MPPGAVKSRPCVDGCGGPDGHRHTGRAGPRRTRLAARSRRLHDGRLSAGGGRVPDGGTDRPGDGGRLARAARAPGRHHDRVAAHVPQPRPLRRTAVPVPAGPELLVLAGLVGAAGPGDLARPAARPRLPLARRTARAGARPCARGAPAGRHRPPGALSARLPLLSRQGLGPARTAHRDPRRRPAARHRGRPVRRHGSGPARDVRPGRAAALGLADAVPQRAAPAQGATLLARPRPRGHRTQRRRPPPLPGRAPDRPDVHGHGRPPGGDRRVRRLRRVRRRGGPGRAGDGRPGHPRRGPRPGRRGHRAGRGARHRAAGRRAAARPDPYRPRRRSHLRRPYGRRRRCPRSRCRRASRRGPPIPYGSRRRSPSWRAWSAWNR